MDFKLPELGEGVYEAEMSRWLIKPGDAVKPGQGLLEVLTDKATMEVPAPFAGSIDRLHVGEGQQIKIGQPLLSYTPVAGDSNKAPAEAEQAAPVSKAEPPATVTAAQSGNGPPARTSALPVKAAPSVRLMARKLGLDLSSVRGSGPDGRILIDDLSRVIPAAAGSPRAKPQAPALDYGKPGTRIKLQGVRRKIAEHMVHAKHTIPHYTYVDECDVGEMVRLRDALRDSFAAKGARITYLAFVVKAVVHALKEVPIVNASLDDQAGEIILHDLYNIGIAVATPAGLVVPVIHAADKLDLVETARQIERLGTEAREGKTRLDDLRGGTFSITSIGNIGGLFATPIINHPQVAILGVGKIVRRPVFDDQGEISAAQMVYLSLSFDHRVVDGAVGTAFGNALIQRLRNPAAMLVE